MNKEYFGKENENGNCDRTRKWQGIGIDKCGKIPTQHSSFDMTREVHVQQVLGLGPVKGDINSTARNGGNSWVTCAPRQEQRS